MADRSMAEWLDHHGMTFGEFSGGITGYTMPSRSEAHLLVQGVDSDFPTEPDYAAPRDLDVPTFVGYYGADDDAPRGWMVFSSLRAFLEMLDLVKGPPSA